MRVALFGSPSFALHCLEVLRSQHDLVLVVTQPDKKAGRGLKLQACPVAMQARKIGVRLEQPTSLKKNEDFLDLIRVLELDVAITAAYGKILPQALLDLPKHGFLNVHASLLPKYRGAAPIQWALINGESETGISIMQTEAGLDTGAVRFQLKVHIEQEENAAMLFEKLADLGARSLSAALSQLGRDSLPSIPQNDDDATQAPMLKKDDGKIRWQDSAVEIFNRYRGVFMWPGSWTVWSEKMLKVQGLKPQLEDCDAGKVLNISPEGVLVGTAKGSILLTTVQPAGKAKMDARDWANGYGVKVGSHIG